MMTASVKMDGRCLTRNNFYANLSISLLSYYIFDMTPLAIHMKNKDTAFACVLTAIFLTKIINSILASGVRNFKVRLDVFGIHGDYHRIFYAEKEDCCFYNKKVSPHFFKYIFPLPLILSESCFLKTSNIIFLSSCLK